MKDRKETDGFWDHVYLYVEGAVVMTDLAVHILEFYILQPGEKWGE